MPRWRLFSHLVWATRGRKPLISPARERNVYRVLRQTARRHGVIVHAVGGVEEHVHLAVSIPPSLAVPTAIQRIKGGSARALNAEFGAGFGWQLDHGVDAFGERHLAEVVASIESSTGTMPSRRCGRRSRRSRSPRRTPPARSKRFRRAASVGLVESARRENPGRRGPA